MRIEFLQHHLPYAAGQVVDHPDLEFVAAVVSRGIAQEAGLTFENHGRHLGVAADTSAAEAALKKVDDQVKKLGESISGTSKKAKTQKPKEAKKPKQEAPATQPEASENPQGS